MAHDWRKSIAASVLALAAGTGLAAEAAAQAGGGATQGAAEERAARDRAVAAEEANGEYCTQIDPSALTDAPTPRQYVDNAIQACIGERQSELVASDRRTRTLSRVSAGGGVGAVVSGLTAQSIGTTNAWLALGFGPVVADDVQQRRRVAAIRHEYVARLNQLQCRADYLYEEQSYLDDDEETLAAEIGALEEILMRVIPSVDRRADKASPEGQFAAVVDEALRIVEQATLLRIFTRSLLDGDHGIERLEAISYNYLAAEFERMRRGTLARPELTFRSILAAPLRAAARVVGGSEQATNVSYASQIQAEPSTFAAQYKIAPSVTAAEVTALNLRLTAPHYLRVPQSRQATAREVLASAQTLSGHGVELRRYVLQFLDAGADQNPAACPTYRPPTVTTGSNGSN